jgi:hypothetical protein
LPRKRKGFFTVGQGNKIVDAVFHPLAKRDPRYWLVDAIAHGIIEQDPLASVQKFVRYTLPKMIEQYQQNARKYRKRY